jgi:plastocyanin
MRAATVLVAIALAAVATGCGEKRHTSSGGSGSGKAPSLTISETEYSLTPPTTPAVAPGATIRVFNGGTIKHALAIKTANGEVKVKPLASRQSATFTAPDKASVYEMYCPIDHHKQNGMIGQLIVGNGGSSGGGGSTTNGGGGGGGGGY